MIKRTLKYCFFFLFLASLVAEAQEDKQPLTLEAIVGGAFYPQPAGVGFTFAEDGISYTTLSKDRQRIEQYNFDTGRQVAVLFDLAEVKGETKPEAIESYKVAPGGKSILIYTEIDPIYRRSWQARAYHYDVESKLLKLLSCSEAKVKIPTYSPDAKQIAFVRENNLFIANPEKGSEIAVTSDGRFNEIIYGTSDWVYEEEFTTTKLLSWSEDNRFLAYGRFDERAIPEYGFQLYGEGTPFAYMYKYPFAGGENSKVSIHIYDTKTGESRQVKLPVEEELYIPRIEFTPMEGRLALFTLNRHQNLFRLYLVDPATLAVELVLTDSDEAYVSDDVLNSLVVERDGFVMLSERQGYMQIYRFDKHGKKARCLTPGEYDVTALYGVDKKGNVYYQAADEMPIGRRVLKVSRQGKITLLAGERGVNSASFSSDFSRFLGIRSHREMPHHFAIYRSSDAKLVRTLEENQALSQKLASHCIPKTEFTTLKGEGDILFNAYLIKPTDFNPDKRYPLVMVQYSGPNSQEVLDHYAMDWTYYLAQQGYIVACVDGRGTGARGSQWRKCTYLQLGLLESDDQLAAARSLAKLPYIDQERMAIWGWSFGGYNTLLCLTRGDGLFKAGIAVAPVTDWRFYDTVYTERFMRTPQENPEGYQVGSPLALARSLKGNLLIIHGSADDNVHIRNTMRFVEELIQADIPFEMAVYPDKNHGIYGGKTRLHLYKRKIEFLNRNL